MSPKRPSLNLGTLKKMAALFCKRPENGKIHELYGITDGKAVGTFIEKAFMRFLLDKYSFEEGNSAYGIDFPESGLNTDIKVTSIVQPQSSCPFRNAAQKVYGLGYNILLFVYEKEDIRHRKGNYTKLTFISCAFISHERTADYQLTKSVLEILKNKGTKEDLLAYFEDKQLPGDEIVHNALVDEMFKRPPIQGYLTISNALQWRLQYKRIVNMQSCNGVEKLL